MKKKCRYLLVSYPDHEREQPEKEAASDNLERLLAKAKTELEHEYWDILDTTKITVVKVKHFRVVHSDQDFD